MDRRLACLLLLFLASAAPAAAQLPERVERNSPTPVWLPRGAFLGTFLKGGAVVPQVRVQWEGTLIQERIDAFAFILEGGGGYAVGKPDNAGPRENLHLVQLYEFTAQGGFGYRGDWKSGWHAGAQVLAGPIHYGAKYEVLAPEKRTAGIVEGRLQLGHSVGPFVLGGAVGYGELFGVSRRSNALQYLGGLSLGLFADWR
ncbi:hypothetical protein FGE12_17500 [Aggregicoccus sp. 17bor-14]|uniref:hypothetical protein n=1 Tax=Myxococcaceae TaxID=31 RepID=UPI00129CFC4B|nr:MULTISPECIES: hypothetical protein [Myxococcaceae]MBF5044198.1 hypothetical protein [Simulacricoccus sp. 17bor-14]MRI89948.1 hypothetical protein [Aggregicoccus sp. 17bor-14]